MKTYNSLHVCIERLKDGSFYAHWVIFEFIKVAGHECCFFDSFSESKAKTFFKDLKKLYKKFNIEDNIDKLIARINNENCVEYKHKLS